MFQISVITVCFLSIMIIYDIPKTKFTQRYEVEVENLKIIYTGEWRKGVAIGYSRNPMGHEDIPNLISKDKVLYRGDNDYYHVEEIYRTSEGYYLVYYYRDCSAPGKDFDYRGPFLKYAISEDGKTKICPYEMINGDIKSGWYDSNYKKVFVPKEMGNGIVEFNNSFYRLDDFEKLFEIPQKFKIESIFEHGLCLVSVPKDNRDFIVTVKNNEAVDYVDVNDADKLVKLIEKTNNTSLIKYSNREDNAVINVIKEMQETIENQEYYEKWEHLKKVDYYSAYTYPRHYISEESVSMTDFEKGIILSKEELEIIHELYQTVCEEGEDENWEKYRFHIRKMVQFTDCCLECMFYKDFMLLRIGRNKYDEHKMFRFYYLDGKCMSKKIYRKLHSTKDYTKVEDDKNFNNCHFYYSNGYKECGIIVIKDGKLYDNPFPEFMLDGQHLSVKEHFICYGTEKYDFFYNKITINNVNLKIEEVIKKYLFEMKPDFNCYIVIDHYQADEKIIDGKLCSPTPEMLTNIQNELHLRRKNIPNYIEEVIHIADYLDDKNKPYSLYLFKCRPHAYCNTEGQVFYDFNPDKVVL